MIYNKLSGFSDEIDPSVDIQFEVLDRLGIHYFEPRGIDGKNISTLTDTQVQSLKEKMARHHIRASSIGSPVGKSYIEDDFREDFLLFQRVVAIARELGTRYIRIFSFFTREQQWDEAKRQEVLHRLRVMIAYAREQDVVLLHENEKNVYGDTVDRCVDLMENLYCDHFRAVFDPANFIQCGQDTKYALEKLEAYIAYLHIKDARGDKVVPAGHGDGNVAHILKTLFEKGFDGFLSLEPHLGNFEGLQALELDDHMKGLPQGGEGTFTLAYKALNKILDTILQGKDE